MKQSMFTTSGTCSRFINFELDDDMCLHNVQFIGGCPGNTIGIAHMVEGMKAEDVIKRLKGIKCGYKKTSCPDQLALALEKELTEHSTH